MNQVLFYGLGDRPSDAYRPFHSHRMSDRLLQGTDEDSVFPEIYR